MAKTKETKVAVRGEDPKKAPKASKTARKVPPYHEEIVKDSDSSDSSDSESSSGSDSESELEKQKSTKKPNVKKAKATEPNDPPVPDDSSDESSDDDDDESSDDGAAMKTLKAGKTSKKNEPATVSTNGKVSKSKDVVSASDDESDEDESSAKAGVAEESDGSDEDMEDAPEYNSTAKRQAQAQATIDPTRAVAPQPYEPPAGYKHLDTSKANATTLDQLLANPGSKQIWHITAPSSVPISQIHSVSLASIQNQSSILSHKGTDYTLAEEKESKTTKKVFVPGKKGYNPSEVPVSKSLVLQQVISIPELDSSNIGPKPHRGPRPQPKGLRMRYKPFGFGAGDPGAILGSDESEDEDISMTEPVAFKAPSALRQSEKEKERKRKRDEKEAAEQTSTPRGEKKRRKDKEGAAAAATKKPQTLEPEEDKQVLKGQEDAVMQIEESLIEGTQKEVPQTEEEKARKKAEKKEKKEKKKSKK